jgi:structural maintenance of chromosome 2
MYEAKKQAAEKTIEKKDAKLKEINNILAEEINPTLSKLKEERSAYLGTPGSISFGVSITLILCPFRNIYLSFRSEFQKIQRELEHLKKLYLAYKFVCAQEASTKSDEELLQVSFCN